MKTPLLLVLICTSCSNFHVVQTDQSPQRTVTTDIKATAWFSSVQNVAKLKATQTEKSQYFGADGGSQQGSTNTIEALNALARIAEAVRPAP